MRISDWSSDVCSSDLQERPRIGVLLRRDRFERFVSAIVYIPREKFNTDIRRKFGEVLAEAHNGGQIGRASGRERVCQYVYISVVAVSLKKKKNEMLHTIRHE